MTTATQGQYNVLGADLTIGVGVVLGHFNEIGDGCVIGDHTVIQGRARFASKCIIGTRATIKIGVILTAKTHIGAYTFVGPNVVCLGAHNNEKVTSPTIIGRNCFIGASSIIMPGVEICDGVTIGAMSFVNKDITEPGVYVGQPIRKVG